MQRKRQTSLLVASGRPCSFGDSFWHRLRRSRSTISSTASFCVGHLVSLGEVGFNLLLAFFGPLIEFAEHGFLRRSWPVIGHVNVCRQVGEMIAQLGLKEQAPFARFH